MSDAENELGGALVRLDGMESGGDVRSVDAGRVGSDA